MPASENTGPEEIKLARLKIYAGVAKWFLTGVVVTIVSIVLNHQYQTTKLANEKQVQDARLALQKQESEGSYLAQFVDRALDDDLETRIQFAHYFATLTVSQQLKSNWTKYHKDLMHERETSIQTIEEKVSEIHAFPNNQEADLARITGLRMQIDRLKQRIDSRSIESMSAIPGSATEQTLKEGDVDVNLTSIATVDEYGLWTLHNELRNNTAKAVRFVWQDMLWSGFMPANENARSSITLATSPKRKKTEIMIADRTFLVEAFVVK